MIEKTHLKECLSKAFKKKEISDTIFRYTTTTDIDINNCLLNSKNNNIFYISYSDKKYFGLDKCIEYNLISKKSILELVNNNNKVISYGINTNTDIKFFGGVGFDMNNNFSYPAQDLPKGLFFIPKILIEDTNNSITISFQTLLNKDIDSIINEYCKLESVLNFKSVSKQYYNEVIDNISIPSKSDYSKIFNSYIDDINNNQYDKIVLSRMKKITLKSELNYENIFKAMDNNCTNFLFTLNKNEKFFGSSPEKLIHLLNNNFISEAIAGTYPQKKTHNKKSLLNNKKELSEHNFVITHLVEILKKYSDDIHISKSKILELTHLSHIQTLINGKLKKNIHILELLYYLYPTPAVAGYPVKKTITKINKSEPFSRGWYSGCFGWFDQIGNGKFDVSIRCALSKNKTLILLSGGGIVKKSTLENEWDETKTKFEHLLSSIAKK